TDRDLVSGAARAERSRHRRGDLAFLIKPGAFDLAPGGLRHLRAPAAFDHQLQHLRAELARGAVLLDEVEAHVIKVLRLQPLDLLDGWEQLVLMMLDEAGE